MIQILLFLRLESRINNIISVSCCDDVVEQDVSRGNTLRRGNIVRHGIIVKGRSDYIINNFRVNRRFLSFCL